MYNWFLEGSKGFMECKECGQGMCFTHKKKWHMSKSYTEADTICDLLGGARWLVIILGSDNYKQCSNPSCKVGIEKN